MSQFLNPNNLSTEKSLNEVSRAEDDDDLLLLAEEDALILAEEDAKPIAAISVSAEDYQSPFINPTTTTWKVLIADDEKEIHEVTQLALQGFVFKGKPLNLLSAYSGREAKEMLVQHPDVALVFLDVVMEKNDAGLDVVKYIRETLNNKLVRIVLRTGQPGEAPEESIIVDYDINDYKLKTELTQRKLFTTLIAGLRAYHDLLTLEVNKHFSKQVLESVPVGVTVYNADGSMHYANKRAIHLLGKGIVPSASTEESIEVYQLYLAGTQQLYPADRSPVTLALQGQSVCIDDLEIHQSAKVIPVETWSTPIYDEKNQVIQAIVAFQDITERRQAEADRICLIQEQEAKNIALRYNREIESKNAELVKLNQEKNEFLGIVAHDLKNPLSAILGLSDMIFNDLEELTWDEITECSRGITMSANQMFNLIVNLLDVNRIESGQLEPNLAPTNLLLIMQQLVKNYQDRAQHKDITLHLEAIERQYLILVDANLTVQVFDNLISNAVKYSPCGKNVYIRLMYTEHCVRCEIQDEGPGLSEKDQQKLFSKFARLSTKPTGGEHSTGLGLFIVKRLVTAMGGEVWCKSELERGSTFVVEFAILSDLSN